MLSGLPLFLASPRILCFDLAANRRHPDLAALRAEPDPERFLWRVLPHAARSFALSILCLSRSHAKAAALAYLQCRMLDTVEDLAVDPLERRRALEGMACRLREGAALKPPLHWKRQDARDDVHLLLLERAADVDQITLALPEHERALLLALVEEMALGMLRCDAARSAGGAFPDDRALVDYCDVVIGSPLRFCMALFLGGARDAASRTEKARAHIREASAFLQLANISRDLEKDLARGVAHVPELEPFLLQREAPALDAAVRGARLRLSRLALGFTAGFDAAVAAVAPGTLSPAALAARVMRQTTLRHHQRMLRRALAQD